MKKTVIALTLATAALLSGCATTASKPLTFDQLGQYSTTPLNANTYRISFQARPNMSFGTAEEITLLKAAQTTVQNGFQFFQVLNDPSNRTQQPPRQAISIRRLASIHTAIIVLMVIPDAIRDSGLIHSMISPILLL